MFQQLSTYLRLSVWFVLISLLLVQCKKTEDAPVTPTTPVTNPTSTTTAPSLTDVAKAKTGLLPLTTAEYEQIPIYVAKTYKGGRRAALAAVDLTAKMPPVGDQGNQGSCTAWATAYAMRSYLYHTDSPKPYLLSSGGLNKDAVFSPAFVYNLINNGSDLGSKPRDAYSLMIRDGVCTLNDMPYQADYPSYLTQPSTDQKQKASNFKIAGYGRTLINAENFKACLSQGVAIQLTVKTDRNFNTPSDQVAGEYIWKAFDQASGGGFHAYHALVLVGYDDTKNAFKLMNSWGDGWANKGFIWMDYGLLSPVVTEAYIPYTTSSFAQLAVYDPSTSYSGSGTWTQKTDFTGPNHTSLESVAFTIDNIVYVCGSGVDFNESDKAWLGKAELYAYNPATNAWSKKAAKLPATANDYKAYSGMASFVIGKKGYLVTGFDNSEGNIQRRVFEYDPDKDTWTAKKPLPFDKNLSRFSPVSTSYNGKGYFGLNATIGQAAHGRELWEYDPTADSWQLKASLPANFDVGTATAWGVIDGKLYLAYSQTSPIPEKGNTLLYEYNFATNTWSKKRSLGNMDLDPWGISGVLNGKLYCGLTYTNAGAGKTSNNYLFAYDAQTDNWTQVKDFPGTDRASKLGVMANGKLYVGFGSNFVNGKGNTYFSDWWEYAP